MTIFPTFFLGNIGQENVFYDILEQKTPFLGYETKSSRRRKIDIFPKGLTHGFSPKITIFTNFFFRQYIGQENVFYDILEPKNAFLAYKNRKFKKWKNWHFSKRVNAWFFLEKWPFFLLFF